MNRSKKIAVYGIGAIILIYGIWYGTGHFIRHIVMQEYKKRIKHENSELNQQGMSDFSLFEEGYPVAIENIKLSLWKGFPFWWHFELQQKTEADTLMSELKKKLSQSNAYQNLSPQQRLQKERLFSLIPSRVKFIDSNFLFTASWLSLLPSHAFKVYNDANVRLKEIPYSDAAIDIQGHFNASIENTELNASHTYIQANLKDKPLGKIKCDFHEVIKKKDKQKEKNLIEFTLDINKDIVKYFLQSVNKFFLQRDPMNKDFAPVLALADKILPLKLYLKSRNVYPVACDEAMIRGTQTITSACFPAVIQIDSLLEIGNKQKMPIEIKLALKPQNISSLKAIDLDDLQAILSAWVSEKDLKDLMMAFGGNLEAMKQFPLSPDGKIVLKAHISAKQLIASVNGIPIPLGNLGSQNQYLTQMIMNYLKLLLFRKKFKLMD